jgi:hypothetical protein
VQAEFAVIADRDDDVGAGAVPGAVDREAVDRFVDLGAALIELRRRGRELVGPVVTGDLFELAEALFDALDFGGEFGRDLGRLGAHAAVLRQAMVIGIEEGLGPGPLRVQFSGLGFKLFDREPAHQRGIVEEAVFIAALKRSRVTLPPAAS